MTPRTHPLPSPHTTHCARPFASLELLFFFCRRSRRLCVQQNLSVMAGLSLTAVGARLRLGARLLAPTRPLWAAPTAATSGEFRSSSSVSPSYSRLHTSARLAQYRAKGEMRIAVIGQSLFGQEVSQKPDTMHLSSSCRASLLF